MQTAAPPRPERTQEETDVHLSIPVHRGKDIGIGNLKKLIARAGLSNEEYLDIFYDK